MRKTFGSNRERYSKDIDYVHSPRVNGKLVLCANPVLVNEDVCLYWRTDLDPWTPYTQACWDRYLSSDSAYSQAYARAFAKFQSKCNLESELMLAVDFKERQKTIDMLGTAFSRVRQATKAIKRGQLFRASQLLGVNPRGRAGKAVATTAIRAKGLISNGRGGFVYPHELWLEYRYGWAPLMGTLYGLAEKLADIPRPSFITVGAECELTAKNWDEPVMRQFCNGKVHTVLSGKISAVNNTVVSLRDYGVINPAAILWEVIPFSFVVDWFVGVGDYITNYTALAGLTFDNLSQTTHTYVERREIFRSSWGSPGGVYSYQTKYFGQDIYAGELRSLHRFNRKRRAVLTSLPVPDLQLGKGLNKKRTVDAISLAIGVLSSLRRK